MDGVEINHLRAFVALADHRHFGQAAADMGMSQPTLSKRIAALEMNPHPQYHPGG